MHLCIFCIILYPLINVNRFQKLWISSHLLKKSLMENVIFYAAITCFGVKLEIMQSNRMGNLSPIDFLHYFVLLQSCYKGLWLVFTIFSGPLQSYVRNFFYCNRTGNRMVNRWSQGSYQLGELWKTGVFREKRLSLQVIREKVFFEEISGRNLM